MIRVLVALVVGAVVVPGAALACGCFHDPSPIEPVVQTGERILFHARDGQVTAHIQISYQGTDASSFGWTVPLPSIPTLEVGDDAVFTALGSATDPVFPVTVSRRLCDATVRTSTAGGGGCGFDLFSFGGSGGPPRATVSPTQQFGAGRPNPVVLASTVGPYDFAVLKADDKTALLDWIKANRFFLPTASDGALAPYLGPGRFFLALRLQPGRNTGDIKPVIVHYASDLPMIPLTLTAATSLPVLPVTVWLLGSGRAIPRNYHHSVLNEAALSWLGGADNYGALVARAAGEAPAGQSFITEFSGPAAAVAPTIPQAYQALFAAPLKLTRLFTAIGAVAMTEDPVFSFNPDLPDVPALHAGQLDLDCSGQSGALTVPGGLSVPFQGGALVTPTMPASQRIEVLREAGAPEVVVDNTAAILTALGDPSAPPPADLGAPAGDADVGDGGIARRERRPARRGDLALFAIPVVAGLLRLGRRRRV